MLSRSHGCELLRGVFGIFIDALTFFCLTLRSSSALAAENLFLRKQLGLYVERKRKPRRATNSIRFTLAQLMRFFRLALGPYGCEARHIGPLASKGVPILLEVEVSVKRQAESFDGCPEVDRRDGFRQSDLGRGTHRE